MDIGLGLTVWKAYEVSEVETSARLYICSKSSQPLAEKELVSSEWGQVLTGFGLT